MNIQFADIVQIIVALIGFVGIVYSPRRGKREKTTSPSKRLDSNKVLWASIFLLTANLAIFGWRYWGPPSECNELNIPIDAIPVSIMEEGGFITATITSSGDLELDFRNGQGYSGAVLLTPALNVRGCTHLDINGTSTEDFKLTMEYRAQGGKTLARHEYKTVSAAPEPQTIRVPLEYDGIVDEIALLFEVEGEESKVTIKSINLK